MEKMEISENKNELALEDVNEIMKNIKYSNWNFHIGEMGEGFYLQARFKAEDIDTGEIEIQHGRKWYISRYSTKDEIVRTAFLAVMTASEHEIRENFTYKEKSIFGPHISIDALDNAAKEIVFRK